ncbi:MAG: VanW family protein [Anaerolineaceae bacterium]|nr:VanW family protein [Anaerolineaceae bacterium]
MDMQDFNLRSKPIISMLMGGFFFSMIVGFIFLLGFELIYIGRIYPGVNVSGIPIGGKTKQDAEILLAQSIEYPYQGKILLQDGEKQWLVSPVEIGLVFDAKTTVQEAYQIGRSTGLFANLFTQWANLVNGIEEPPSFVYDARVGGAYLEQINQQIYKPVIEPSIVVSGTQVGVLEGEKGHVMHVPNSLALLALQMQSMQDGIIPLFIEENQPIVMNVDQQAEQARRILSQPMRIMMPENQPEQQGPWVFPPEQLSGLLHFNIVENGEGATYQIGLDEPALQNMLNTLAPDLALDGQNPRFIFNDSTRQLDLLETAVIGRELDVPGSMQYIQEKLLAGDHDITLQFAYTEPPVLNDTPGESIGITELVHEESSYFYGSSAARVQNITQAARRFHGLLVAPGETFSMATALGNISLDNGYAEALIIYGDQTIKGVGGGVCQVSTTLFRAAFFSGYPVVERHAHAYRVYYYEKIAGNSIDPKLAGLDATVYVPVVDFKFTNDTANWLLMETYVNPSYSSITWKFYSTKDGRSVSWETSGLQDVVEAPDPLYTENDELETGEVKKVDYEADGAEVTVRRTVSRDGQVIDQDTFVTHYQPWQAKYEYGPGTEGMPPEDNGEDED